MKSLSFAIAALLLWPSSSATAGDNTSNFAGPVFQFAGPVHFKIHTDIPTPAADIYYAAGLSPFSYMCTSIQCVDEGNHRNSDSGSRSDRGNGYLAFSPPYKPIVALNHNDILAELAKDRMVFIDSNNSVHLQTKYAYAFLPKQYIGNVHEKKYSHFIVRSGHYLYRTVAVAVSPDVERGLAICKIRLGKHGAGYPFSCVLIAMFDGNEYLYRAIVAQVNTFGADPFTISAFSNVKHASNEDNPGSELDRTSSTPSWRIAASPGLHVDDACLRRWPIVLANELANDKDVRLSKDYFDVALEGHSIIVDGESGLRKSPMNSDKWERLGVRFKLIIHAEIIDDVDVILWGGIGAQQDPLVYPSPDFFEFYYEKIMTDILKSHANVCR